MHLLIQSLKYLTHTQLALYKLPTTTYRKRSIEDLDIDNLNQIIAIKHTSLSYICICILKQRAIDFPRLLMYTNRHPEDGNNC